MQVSCAGVGLTLSALRGAHTHIDVKLGAVGAWPDLKRRRRAEAELRSHIDPVS